MRSNVTLLAAGFAMMSLTAATTRAQSFDLSWHTINGGGATSIAGGAYTLGGTIGQPDAQASPVMSGGNFELIGGFWAASAASGSGVPAATAIAAVSRKVNAAGPGGFCDLALVPGPRTEPRQGGVTEVHITFDVPPGAPGTDLVTIEQATCASPAYAPYGGASVASGSVVGNTLVLSFNPALENARTYKLTLSAGVTSIAGQFVEVSGLLGDVNADGRANATDRSLAVGVWTSAIHFSCVADINNDGATNATDRSLIVGAWTGPQNCAP